MGITGEDWTDGAMPAVRARGPPAIEDGPRGGPSRVRRIAEVASDSDSDESPSGGTVWSPGGTPHHPGSPVAQPQQQLPEANTARKWLRVYDGLASRPVIGVNTARKWLRIYDGYYSATIIIGKLHHLSRSGKYSPI